MNYKSVLIASIIGITFLGCDRNFEEVNNNPNDPVTIPADLLLGNLLFNTANILYDVFASVDQGSGWAQHISKVQYNTEMRYIPREEAINDVWQSFYEITAADANRMVLLATQQENTALQGIGYIMQAYGFLMLTDIFGDIPFTDALKAEEGVVTPSYDSQELVYNGCLTLLDKAILLLTASTNTISQEQDLMFAGNISLWVKFASTLKFRALMRQSSKIPVSDALQQLVESGNLMSSKNDEAKLIYLELAPNANPFFETIVFGGRPEYKINTTLVGYMDGSKSISDPRLQSYATPNSTGEYRGKPSGFRDLPNNDFNYANVSGIGGIYLSATAPAYFLSYTELQFLLAEAAIKGFISGGDSAAESYYLNGIASSFEENLVSESFDVYVEQSSVRYIPSTAFEQISLQKWIALYGQGMETWIEWRRTDIPNLVPAFESDLGKIPVRFTYPTIESSLNRINYNSAIARQGSDELTTSVWWDMK